MMFDLTNDSKRKTTVPRCHLIGQSLSRIQIPPLTALLRGNHSINKARLSIYL